MSKVGSLNNRVGSVIPSKLDFIPSKETPQSSKVGSKLN
jgi:hypothetical protein